MEHFSSTISLGRKYQGSKPVFLSHLRERLWRGKKGKKQNKQNVFPGNSCFLSSRKHSGLTHSPGPHHRVRLHSTSGAAVQPVLVQSRDSFLRGHWLVWAKDRMERSTPLTAPPPRFSCNLRGQNPQSASAMRLLYFPSLRDPSEPSRVSTALDPQ